MARKLKLIIVSMILIVVDIGNFFEQLHSLIRLLIEKNLSAVLLKAKKAYIADLKSEMLSRKAGFDFSE